MSLRSMVVVAGVFASSAGFMYSQEPNAPPPAASSAPVIRSETRVVLVDAVVTDKKGAYVHDLTQKDFKVWEDNKEQTVTSFSFEADPASPLSSQKRYIVLFFDNSTMDFGQQAQAREAAAKFIQSNAGPNRLMAVVNYGGNLQISQNFTDNAERLSAVVKNVKFSSVTPNDPGDPSMVQASTGGVQLSNSMASFAARDMILGLRSLVKNLGSVPGRKTLVLFTAGFRVGPDELPEVTATIDACNRSNVAIYPIDARGLATSTDSIAGPHGAMLFAPPVNQWTVQLLPVNLEAGALLPAPVLFALGQRGPGGGGGTPGGGSTGGGRGGGSTGGSTGSTGGGRTGGTPGNGTGSTRTGVGSTTTNTGATRGGGGGPANNLNNPMYNPLNQPRNLIPKFPDSVADNQQLMYMLAQGTGGFVIVNTNDLLGGLEKIGKEQNQYYLLGYTPPESKEGACHTLRVKVDRGGTSTRYRTGYCDAKPRDLLAGNSVEKTLEAQVAAAPGRNSGGSLEAPFFYTSPNVARVNVAMEISTENMKFEKQKGKFQTTMNVLGIAYKPDGAIAARFSDAVKLAFDNKKEMEQFKEHPLHYENQFDVAAGKYTLKVAFTAGGESFGKVEAPLGIDPYESSQFTVSSLALSKQTVRAADNAGSLDVALIEDRTPLVVQGMQVIPAGSYHFKQDEHPAMYFEVYEPLLLSWKDAKPPAVAIQVRILDRKTGQQKEDTGMFRLDVPAKNGNPVIPVGARVPSEKLAPGAYRLELLAMDQAGKKFTRTADFDIE